MNISNLMKKIFITIFLIAAIPSFAQMNPVWKNNFGTPLFNGAYPSAIVLDDSSNAYILEAVMNSQSSDRSACYDAMLHKVNKTGELIWYKNLRTVPCQDGRTFSLKYFKGNLYGIVYRTDTLNGIGANYYCIAKVSTNGELKWVKPLGYWDFEMEKHFQIYDNQIYIIASKGNTYGGKIYKLSEDGIIKDSLVLRNQNPNLYITNFEKLSNGNYALNVYEPVPKERMYSQIVVDSAGYLKSMTDYDLTCENFHFLKGTDNSFYEYHYRNEQLIGYYVVISKYNNNGGLIWRKETLGPVTMPEYYDYNRPPKLMFLPDNNLILCNTSARNLYENVNITSVKKLNYLTGDSIWSYRKDVRNFPGYFLDAAIDFSGNIYFTSLGGSLSGAGLGNNYSIVKLNNSGSLLIEKFNDNFLPNYFYPASMRIASNSDIIINGGLSADFYDQSVTIRYTNPLRVEQNGNNIPVNFSLKQNYPNPFNPSTTINFQISKSNFVSLKIYDMNGRELSELVNENLNAGEYKVKFEGAALPSGVYYYKLTSGSFSEVKKMLLVK